MRKQSWLLLSAALALPSVAHAQLASDSFTCGGATLNGAGGGLGWVGNWITGQPNVYQPQPASLPFGIGEVGGSVQYHGASATSGVGARIFRQIDCTPGSIADNAGLVDMTLRFGGGYELALGRPGTTVWLGFLMNGGTAGNGQPGTNLLAQMHLYRGALVDAASLSQGDNNKSGEVVAIGRGNTLINWSIERTCAHDLCPSGATSSSNIASTTVFDSATHWFVIRFVFVSTATTAITVWLDPTPGATPADASALRMNNNLTNNVDGIHFDWVELGGQTAQFTFDEVRVATSFPELSSGASAPNCMVGGNDAGVDAGNDAGVDAAVDVGVDVAVDVPVIPMDGGGDVGTDVTLPQTDTRPGDEVIAATDARSDAGDANAAHDAPDAGGDGGGTIGDSASPHDSGTTTAMHSGCGCHTLPSRAVDWRAFAASAGALMMALRRRRRSRDER